MKKLLIVLIWLPFTIVTLLFTVGYYNVYYANETANKVLDFRQMSFNTVPYQLYSSLPEVLGAKTINTFYIEAQDIMPELIYDYLKQQQSPMLDSYDDLIRTARKYEIDPLFMVSVAQCESNLGKKMPYQDPNHLYECHNPFGWGIHSQGTLCFSSWQEGYEAVAKGLREKYYDDGLNTPEEIMHRYTPPALEKGGSWAKCVNQFIGKLQEIKEGYEE